MSRYENVQLMSRRIGRQRMARAEALISLSRAELNPTGGKDDTWRFWF